MWHNLPEEQRQYYKKLILSFASLSEAFSQKVESEEDETKNSVQGKVAPIVNSKYQETVFQRSFNAQGEDYGNTSYDASVVVDENHKYLVGLKSFGIGSGDQKIAQFKRPQTELGWRSIFNEIAKNAKGLKTKAEIDEVNEHLYRKLAIEISKLRNERIASSKENLKGFIFSENVNVEAVYHYLMPSKKENDPQISVGEVPYYDIDIDNIVINGCTSARKPMNFKFNDGRHQYKYTEADSQLLMSFDKTSLEDWDVQYVEDPFNIFATLGESSMVTEYDRTKKQSSVVQSISWKINIKDVSGFNQFMGLPKNSINSIQALINAVNKNFSDVHGIEHFITLLEKFKKDYPNLPPRPNLARYKRRDEIIECSQSFPFEGNFPIKLGIPVNPLTELVIKHLFRSSKELYIPILKSKKFHDTYPDFFGTGYGILNGKKFVLPLSERQFKLEFLPSHTIIDAQVVQDDGKGIQSSGSQDILGEWILQKVFQLPEFTPLTPERLVELEINGIRLTKFSDADNHIGLEFIWIDEEVPDDYWG